LWSWRGSTALPADWLALAAGRFHVQYFLTRTGVT
jgi:hypothetical protein